MGRVFTEQLDGRAYRCRRCSAHLAHAESLVSTAFHCRYGKAYLFSAVSNVRTGPREERLMTTGMHVVADIWCTQCAAVVGWKYEEAYENAQRYKEGKFILEKGKLVDEECNELRSDTDD